ncbi:BspA family leucine-rich repeat surface protein [Bifidobacterium sp. ESL0682]|uniref:BspA family leucine-rich repeat surface protein n=1 Tax=Bifidobacterium sp. ESL0682 TaxID=2983212 RepID=UPI0023F8C63A|nr:BspA family leucine-rich repeat surface protein [Bifidobacterium sp. ESL0682]WEV42284.1 BspA family leucine-rich repeat surface protein [Bifidobacterium sp. ESL0682]
MAIQRSLPTLLTPRSPLSPTPTISTFGSFDSQPTGASSTNKSKSNSENEQPSVGPQSYCTPSSPAAWGTPATSADGLPNIYGRDSSTVTWYVDSSCTLHISGGTSPDIGKVPAPWIQWVNSSYASRITRVQIEGNLTLYTHWYYMDHNQSAFGQMHNLTSFDTTQGTLHLAGAAAEGFLEFDDSLTTINGIENWDVSQNTHFQNMFMKTTNLRSLNLSGWNMGNALLLDNMFSQDTGLTNLNIANWNTSNVNDVSTMFYGCSGLTSLDLSNWDTSKVDNMSQIFSGCDSLTSLDLSNWDTRAARETTEGGPFLNMLPSSLRHLKLGQHTALLQGYSHSFPAFNNVPANLTWEAYTSSPGHCASITTIGNTAALASRVSQGTNIAGDYYTTDSALSPSCVRLSYMYANGGSGGGWANLEADTTTGSNGFYMPYPSSYISGNPSAKLFTHWNTNSSDTGTSYNSGAYASFPKGANTTYNLYAQWKDMPKPTVSIGATHALAGSTATVDLSASNASAPSGGRMNLTTGQGGSSSCSSSNSCSWNGSNSIAASQLESAPGSTYSVSVTTTANDPATGNAVTSAAGTASGTLPYMNVSFAAGGASGDAPADVKALIDTGAGTASPTLPGKGNLARTGYAFMGWSGGGATWPAGTATISKSAGTTSGACTSLTMTALWQGVPAPHNLTAIYLSGTNEVELAGNADGIGGDSVNACMTQGSIGTDTCLQANRSGQGTGAWQWNVKFKASDYLQRYGYGGTHHFTAIQTSGGATSPSGDLDGVLIG